MVCRIRAIGFISLVLCLISCGGSGSVNPPSVAIHGQVIVSGLSGPMLYIAAPGDPTKAYVIERDGRVKLILNDVLQPTDVLDITGTVDTSGECGLLGIAFDPQYASNKFVYLHYNAGSPIETRIVRYTMNAGGTLLGSPQQIFAFQQTSETNHKGGAINFGADGFLYVMTGDGGGQNDPNNFAQSGNSFLGKILRIDPSTDDFPGDPNQNYGIPLSNPWVGVIGVKPEIWGFGLRNPFRWSVDPVTGGLLIADVGQGAFEEINFEPAGQGMRNYGWNMREGLHDSGNSGPAFSSPFKDPFLEFDHAYGRSVIGGFVYRGSALDPSLQGRYFFGDYITARIGSVPFTLNSGEANPTSSNSIQTHSDSINVSLGANAISGPVSITPDANGEIIVCDLNQGKLIRLVP